eukprot:TRINITY_DN3613_c0_g1_i3.p1 TRINITY_DN3613_c0_g1~~TRINITY_DN3613_c0_g1_i3.p1  ORF type:complete len:829 (-),score=187.55 TRINITY_DN3613_c0_g1_i3:498-2984(-)
MAQMVELQLSRLDSSPWGFRLQGGTDFGTPLLIQKVNSSSPAESSGLHPGDVIIKVNGEPVDNLRHKEVQDRIIRSGNRFNLIVSRGGVLSQTLSRPNKRGTTPSTPRPNPEGREWSGTLEADRAGAANNAEDFTKHFMAQLRGDEPAVLGRQEPIGPDFKYTSNQIGHDNFVEKPGFNNYQGVKTIPQHQINNNINNNNTAETPIKKVANMMNRGQYNSPHHLYSDDNLEEVLTQQAEVLANGVKGIDFNQFNEKCDTKILRNSEVLKYLRETEQNGGKQSYSGLNSSRPNSTASPRTCDSPASTMNRRGSYGAGVRNTSTPTQFSQAQNGRRDSTDGIDNSSNKQKKVGNGFQWPPPANSPPQQTYFNPGSRNQSPAPPRGARFESPARTESPVTSNMVRSNGVQQNCAPQNGHANGIMMTNAPSQNGQSNNIQSANIISQQTQQQQQTAKEEWSKILDAHPLGIAPDPAAPSQNSQSNSIQSTNIISQQTQQQQQTAKEEWSKILDAHPLGIAPDPAAFTQDFMSQLKNQHEMSSGLVGNHNQPSTAVAGMQHQQILPQPFGAVNHQQQQFQLSQQQHQPTMPAPPPQQPANYAPVPQSAPTSVGGGLNNGYNGSGGVSSGNAGGQNVSAPKRGKGVLTQQRPGMRVPMCGGCGGQIRGPFITALGKTWCPGCFLCSMESCRKSLQETGFVEEQGLLYCEDCYAKYLAPDCDKCGKKIIGNCLKAMGKKFHPECFSCAYCGKLFSNSPFYLEDGLPYCEEDWNELFTTKCVSCNFPIEAGDRWVEVLNSNYHSQCFNCTLCKKNLEGEKFFVKGGKPFCKGHAKI